MCYIFIYITVGCRADSECPTTHKCQNRNCEPVCAPSPRPPCGVNAVCHGIAHQAICKCPVGARGDPFVSCITVGCETSDECPSSKACKLVFFAYRLKLCYCKYS